MKALKIILLILYLPIYIVIKLLSIAGEFWFILIGYLVGIVIAGITVLGFIFWFAQTWTLKEALIAFGISTVLYVIYKLLIMIVAYAIGVNEVIISYLTEDIAPV